MAAPGLTIGVRAHRGWALPRCWLAAYLALWASTLAAAAVCALEARGFARALLHLRLAGHRAAPASITHAIALFAHNVPIAAWPLMLGALRAREHPPRRALADAAIVLCALANTMPVGIALGGYGGALLPYMPQLPFEWAGLAVGYGTWLVERRRPLCLAARTGAFALLGALMAAAGALETVAVPHR